MAFTDRLHNRGSISTGYDIDNSLKVENDNREYIRWTNFSTQGSEARKKKFSMSLWCKRTELGRQQIIWSTSQNGYLGFDAADTVVWYQQYVGSSTQIGIRTNRKFRDIGAWYHFMIVVDTAQSTEANRVKMYVNGVQETSFGTPNTYPSQNAQASNLYEQHLILGEWGGGSTGFSGYIAEYYFLSEIAASPTDLGEYDEDSGIWKPKEYDGTISSPSHFLEFKDGSDLGTATSGLDGDYLENLTAADQATDTPTNNFATSNFLISQGGYFVTTEGGTKCVLGLAGPGNNIGGVSALSTIAVSKGKWYMEMKNDLANDSVDSYARFGFVDVGDLADGGVDGQMIAKPGSAGGAYFGGTGGGRYHYNNTAQGNSTTWIRQIMGMALDLDNKKVYFHIDGTYTNSGDPANGTDNGGQYDMNTGGDGIYVDETWVLGASAYNLGIFLMNWGGYTVMPISSAATDANGYGTFEYAPPSGYYALCSKNLGEYG